MLGMWLALYSSLSAFTEFFCVVNWRNSMEMISLPRFWPSQGLDGRWTDYQLWRIRRI